MNGFPLVLLGVVLFAVGYALLKIQGKMKDITAAIDSGFKTIEDGITDNLLGSNGALTKAKSAVDQSYLTLKNQLDS
jgi:microcompartment protein CcmL/EutN